MRPNLHNPHIEQQWRAIDKLGRTCYFDSEESMRRQAPRVARYMRSDLTLQTTRDEPDVVLTLDNQFVDLATEVWDKQKAEPNPTKSVEYTFTGQITARVRLYDCYGVERDLPGSVERNLYDTLNSEMTYEEPERDDLMQAVDDATVTDFVVVSTTDAGDSGVDEDEHVDGDGCATYPTDYQVHSNGDMSTTIDVSDLDAGDTYHDPGNDPAGKWWQVTDVEVVDDDTVHVRSDEEDDED